MTSRGPGRWCGLLLVLAAVGCGEAMEESGSLSPPELEASSVRDLLALPERVPLPAIPEYNPLTPEKIALGRRLFYDTRLSANQTQACASCHLQRLAFADGKVVPIGSTGQPHFRNSQGLANVAYAPSLTWASDNLLTLEDQIQVPLRGDNPVELGISDGAQDAVLARFADDPDYAQRFREAFPESPSGPTINKIAFALASFCRALISFDSPYDRYLGGDTSALTEQQRLGLALFNGERFECFHCHGGVLFTTAYRDARTTADTARYPFFNNGLYNVGDTGGYPERDQGLFELTLNPRDRGLFRPPSLRNVALTAPYMHDGSIATLREVVEHYAAGGRLITEGPHAGDGRVNPQKSGLVRGFQATDEEIDAVVAFLEALTDASFTQRSDLSDPFEP